MVELVLAPKRTKPLGTRIQRKNEETKPQISPAPGLVARRAKNNPKASPKAAPTRPPEESEVFSTTLWSKPPETPSTRPIKVSTRRESERATSSAGALDSVSGTVHLYFKLIVWTISRGKKRSIVQSMSTRILRSKPGNFAR